MEAINFLHSALGRSQALQQSSSEAAPPSFFKQAMSFFLASSSLELFSSFSKVHAFSNGFNCSTSKITRRKSFHSFVIIITVWTELLPLFCRRSTQAVRCFHHAPTCLQYVPRSINWIIQQFHLFNAAPFGVSLPFLLVGPLTPDMRAQNDLRRLEALLPRLSLLGFLVTGRLRLAPVLRFAAARPLALSPPVLACFFGL